MLIIKIIITRFIILFTKFVSNLAVEKRAVLLLIWHKEAPLTRFKDKTILLPVKSGLDHTEEDIGSLI